MAKSNNTGRSIGEAQHIRLYHWMLNCPAWRSLSTNATALLISVWQRYNGRNNGEISYAVREAKYEVGISRNAAARAFHELIDKRFLKVARASSFDLKTQEARLWTLTAVPRGENPATKDFMKWSPSDEKTKPSPVRRTERSRQRDRDRNGATILTNTVPPEGLSATNTASSQSRRRDTSNIPGGGLRERRARACLVASSALETLDAKTT